MFKFLVKVFVCPYPLNILKDQVVTLHLGRFFVESFMLCNLRSRSWVIDFNGAITFAHIFEKFRLCTVLICAQKWISFAHRFSVTFAGMFCTGILLYQGTINKIST